MELHRERFAESSEDEENGVMTMSAGNNVDVCMLKEKARWALYGIMGTDAEEALTTGEQPVCGLDNEKATCE